MTGALAAYQQNSVDTASPVQLITMLFDGLLTGLDRAEAALAQSPCDIATAHGELLRCQAIVTELMQSLNPSTGEVAASLASLYEYCHRQLVEANVTKDFGPAEPVRSIFIDLKGAWAVIVDTTSPEELSA